VSGPVSKGRPQDKGKHRLLVTVSTLCEWCVGWWEVKLNEGKYGVLKAKLDKEMEGEVIYNLFCSSLF